MKPDFQLSAKVLLASCVYGWRRGDSYLYIGQSISVIKRLKTHETVELIDTDIIDIWFCCKSELNRFEAQLINKFVPTFNKIIPGLIDKPKRHNTFSEAFGNKNKDTKRTERSLTAEEEGIVNRLISLKPRL